MDFITATWICLIAGPVIALLVQAFKRIAFVSQHPKIIVALLSLIVAAVQGLAGSGFGWPMLVECLILPFSSAVATYEVLVKPASRPVA